MHIFGNGLRSSCQRRLGGLPVPQPFDLTAFAATVARHRARPLHILLLHGLDGSEELSGAWLAGRTADFVYIDADASPWHRDLIALHEIAHILCGHQASARWMHDLGARVLPGLSDVTLTRMLGRHGYSTSQEREAELMASLILDRADDGPFAVTSPGRAGVAGRLTHALRHPVRYV